MAEEKDTKTDIIRYGTRTSDLLPNREEALASIGPALRGSFLGFFLGLLPGGGALIASFASYMLEHRISRHPERFGHGAPEGVAGPEAANNAAAQASFIPLLCLGIPANAVIGVIMGALLVQGITPGPQLIVEHPELFWGVIASMFVGNLMLIVLNVPLIGLFVALLRVPQGIMAVLIVSFCVIGAFSLNNSMFDVTAMIGFGVLGYALRKADFNLAPLLLAFVMGPLFEQNLRQGLIIGYGDPVVFLQSPISLGFLVAAVGIVLSPHVLKLFGRGRAALQPVPTSAAE
jgi:TctA family transporter